MVWDGSGRCSIARMAVIIFVIEAGYIMSSGFFSLISCPVSASRMMAYSAYSPSVTVGSSSIACTAMPLHMVMNAARMAAVIFFSILAICSHYN